MKKKIQEGIQLKEHISVLKQKDGQNIGYSESERQGTTSSSYINDIDDIELKLTGNSPQGEQDTLHIAELLIKVLNNSGENWSKPEVGEGVDDCIAFDMSNKKKKIEMQVIRASIDKNLWKQLGDKGQINKIEEVNTIITDIKHTIDFKANDQKIPSSYRHTITLVLDANRLSAYTLDKVIEKFHEKYGEEVMSFGFRSIWIVGPREELTHRLDILPKSS